MHQIFHGRILGSRGTVGHGDVKNPFIRFSRWGRIRPKSSNSTQKRPDGVILRGVLVLVLYDKKVASFEVEATELTAGSIGW
jgi:hypothetical protein